jgi:hypothetical protein
MKRLLFTITAAACCAALASAARGDVEVVRLDGDGTFSETINFSGGAWEVEIEATSDPSDPLVLEVRGDQGDVIRFVRVKVLDPGGQNREVFLYVREKPDAGGRIERAEEVKWVTAFPTPNGTLTIEEIRTAGNVGSADNTVGGEVRAHEIGLLDVGGNLTAEVQSSFGIEEVRVAGDVLNHIVTNFGDIEDIDAGGDIGTSQDPVVIASVNNDIGVISASAIYADISAFNQVGRVETLSGGFVGSLEAFQFTTAGVDDPGLFVAGDVDGSIELVHLWFDAKIEIEGSLLSGSEISIVGILWGDGMIEIWSDLIGDITIGESDGLRGQIIINSADVAGEWQGTVKVGTTTLSPKPLYTQTGLGGGAVGEVAFGCHLQDCDPAYDGGNHPVLTSEPGGVVIRHYGPVTWTGMPFIVLQCADGNCQDDDDVTHEWSVANSPGHARCGAGPDRDPLARGVLSLHPRPHGLQRPVVHRYPGNRCARSELHLHVRAGPRLKGDRPPRPIPGEPARLPFFRTEPSF